MVKALSSACFRNPPRFLVDRPLGGEHHDMVDQRASAGSSAPEHSAVIGMKENEMADVVKDVSTSGAIHVPAAPLVAPGSL